MAVTVQYGDRFWDYLITLYKCLQLVQCGRFKVVS